MRKIIRNTLSILMFAVFAQSAFADVSGDWTFTVSLGGMGTGNAAIVMSQEAEGKISGSYAGQLSNGPIKGTYEGNNFEFSFASAATGGEITYKGELNDDGTVKGSVIMRGNAVGTFTGTKK